MLKTSIFINATVVIVVSVLENPAGWSEWYVNLVGPQKLTGNGEPGTVAEFKKYWAGIEYSAPVEIKEVEMNSDGGYSIMQLKGETPGIQKTILTPKDGGTEMTFEIDVAVSESLLKQFKNPLIAAKLNENALEATLKNLKVVCEAPTVWHASEL